ncbi:unnamed protein product [Parnassius apollo]|uniref:(apollo) hypothetical protein n=1 Tax=Parnassius apollo TaxID=110799 RepID=A0A8S3WEZ1_PARAO|nr:unnamed protein product [Parnassius apollo]
MSLAVAEPFVAPVDLQLYPSYALVVAYPIDLSTVRARFENLVGGSLLHSLAATPRHVTQLMSLAVAEPFVAPVDLQLYPSYALVVAYPVDLSTVRARFENLSGWVTTILTRHYTMSRDPPDDARGCRAFYRRPAAAQFDARYLASNAERFNKAHSPIVRQARLVTDLLLYIISNWLNVDVVAKYHELAASYHSSDDEPLATTLHKKLSGGGDGGGGGARWVARCSALLAELSASADAEPFRQPVSPLQAPDYARVVVTPMDLGTVRARLSSGAYSRPEQFARDVRLVFSNSRLYNTNKRSRIYSMTVRLSSLFEALWARVESARSGARSADRPAARSAARSSRAPRSRSARRTRRAARRTRRAARAAKNGKGVGKKSKTSSTEPTPSTSHVVGSQDESVEENGVASDGGSDRSHIQVLEEELADDEVELTYEHQHKTRRKRRRARSSDSSAPASRRRTRRPHKRVRERFSSASCTTSDSSSGSGSGSGGGGGGGSGRYESDRSYRPHRPGYSTDDDAPLLLYSRQRQEGDEAAGPSSRGRNRGGRLRARARGRRYNEDSEEDSPAAISKRLPHHHQRTLQLHQRRQRHATQSASTTAAHTSDHNYFNGHATHNGHASTVSAMSTVSGGSGGSAASGGPVSISSRGRVRKLTAKARGLLRH